MNPDPSASIGSIAAAIGLALVVGGLFAFTASGLGLSPRGNPKKRRARA